MTSKANRSLDWPELTRVAMLESDPGEQRDALVERWLVERRAGGGPTWLLQCSAQEGGLWAGLCTLIEGLVPAIREHAPELLSAHARELCLIVPALRSQLGFPESLTDTVDVEEKTRNYAADRAYRCMHGLIDLLGEWHQLIDPGPLSIACDGYDGANALVRRFFAELVRRRAAALDLRLLIVVGRGQADQIASEFDPAATTLTLPSVRHLVIAQSPGAMTRIALELESQHAAGTLGHEQLPRLVAAWQRSTSPERALRWQLEAALTYNHLGLYEASLPFAADLEAGLDRLLALDVNDYVTAVNAIYFCLVPLGQAQAARRIVEQAIERVTDAAGLAQLHYLVAMLYARFLQPNDQHAAEHHLQRALAILAAADSMPDRERHFMTVFMMNGLALVRVRQRRVPEALELCREGIARLNRYLGPERHRLHRSVLLFNIAQVYAQTGPYEQAIDYLSEAMTLDPNYSEYYNDRGAVYIKLGMLELAERDFLHAIELSPPYAEVWTNLGQCYRAMGRMQQAVAAYSRAIDLDPSSTLAIVGRAEAYCALDCAELALADYTRGLAIEPDQPHILANRAILHYEGGRLHDSLHDLDAALALAPELGELYQNRAIALRELGDHQRAAGDLRTYLRLCPDAEDREQVQASASALAAVISG